MYVTSYNYSPVPAAAIASKYETTNNYYERDIGEYMRGELSDFRTEAPAFESDMPRDMGQFSKTRLNLRHIGTVAEDQPYLPDGTFLDAEFIGEDTRGADGQPRFQDARKQKEARAKFVKFASDADNSVVESGIGPEQMNKQIRKSQQLFKERFNNFDESMGNYTTSSAHNSYKSSETLLTTHDGTIVDLSDTTARNRFDYVGQLSTNLPGVLRMNVPDHRVKISQYSHIRPSAQPSDMSAIYSSVQSAAPAQQSKSSSNKQLAHLIVDAEKIRTMQGKTAQGTSFGTSDSVSARTIGPVDSIISRDVAGSQIITNSIEAENKTPLLNNLDVRFVQAQTAMNHVIAESMALSTKRIGVEIGEDTRHKIASSMAQYGLYIDAQNKSGMAALPSVDVSRKVEDLRTIENAREVHNYAGLLPSANNNRVNTFNGEAYKSQSAEAAPTRKKKYGKLLNDASVNEMHMFEFRDGGLPPEKSREFARVNADDGDSVFAQSLDGFKR